MSHIYPQSYDFQCSSFPCIFHLASFSFYLKKFLKTILIVHLYSWWILSVFGHWKSHYFVIILKGLSAAYSTVPHQTFLSKRSKDSPCMECRWMLFWDPARISGVFSVQFLPLPHSALPSAAALPSPNYQWYLIKSGRLLAPQGGPLPVLWPGNLP